MNLFLTKFWEISVLGTCEITSIDKKMLSFQLNLSPNIYIICKRIVDRFQYDTIFSEIYTFSCILLHADVPVIGPSMPNIAERLFGLLGI